SCIATGVRLAFVRPAASVRSEPGSNSQVNDLELPRAAETTVGNSNLIESPLAHLALALARSLVQGRMYCARVRALPSRHVAACASLPIFTIQRAYHTADGTPIGWENPSVRAGEPVYRRSTTPSQTLS